MKDTHPLWRRPSAFLPVLAATLLLLPACGQGENGEAAADGKVGQAAPATGDVLRGGGFGPVPGKTPAADPNQVVITVDGSPITRGEIDKELVASSYGGMVQPPAVMAQLRKHRGPQAEKRLIEQKLLANAARAQKITVSPEELAAHWVKIEKQLPEGMSRAKFLQSKGLTEAQANEQITENLRLEKLFKPHTSVPETTDEEAKKFYDKNAARLGTPAQVRARHILIKVPGTAPDAEKARVKQQLADIRAKILAKEVTFEAMAMQHSGCPSKKDGGDLNWFGRGRMVPEFDTLAFTMDKGKITEPFLTSFGYHILQVTDKREARTPSFEEMKPKIKAHFEQQARQRAQAAYVQKLRAAAKIERPAATK